LILLTVAGSLNDDKCLVMEETIEFIGTDSSSPNASTIIYFESGATISVKETLEEVHDAITNARKTPAEA
jgi:uncharacterized protein YlzI (FlbEa/FlbD family)